MLVCRQSMRSIINFLVYENVTDLIKQNIHNILTNKEIFIMITPEELIQELRASYGYEVDLSYAINYIDTVGQCAEVDSFHLWLQDLSMT